MCGIFGIEGNDEAIATKAIEVMSYRGRDGEGIHQSKRFTLAHVLHAINSRVAQPVYGKGILVSNCEIYNWRELGKSYDIDAENDSVLLLLLMDKLGFRQSLRFLDGPFAVAYDDGRGIYLARDILGVKPLWYSENPFCFASEKKTLDKLGLSGAKELSPRKVLYFDYHKKKIIYHTRSFFRIANPLSCHEKDIRHDLTRLITSAVAKRIPQKKFGILFSGGIDSSLIAFICKQLGKRPTLYTAALRQIGMKEAEDLFYARRAASALGLPLKVKTVDLSNTQRHIKEVIRIIEDRNVVKVGVALPFHLSCIEAAKDGCKVLLSGLGSEEIFAGYERHKQAVDINRECRKGLLIMHERDNYRDDCISMSSTIELRHPFLDHRLIRYSLKIPGKYKIEGDELKMILRKTAIDIGLPKEFAMRKKRAAQYGSNFDKALSKLAKKKGMKKSFYLNSL